MNYPPTIIIVHPREKRSKCTVEPLRSRADFTFRTFSDLDVEIPTGYVRLSLDGPLISSADNPSGLLVLDGTWRLSDRMEKFFRNVPGRSLPAIQTAYPRVSRLYPDPHGGLATIEAIYATYRLLGRPCDGLLDGYHWAGEFLSRNNWSEQPRAVC